MPRCNERLLKRILRIVHAQRRQKSTDGRLVGVHDDIKRGGVTGRRATKQARVIVRDPARVPHYARFTGHVLKPRRLYSGHVPNTPVSRGMIPR